jgi:hypothetical protein
MESILSINVLFKKFIIPKFPNRISIKHFYIIYSFFVTILLIIQNIFMKKNKVINGHLPNLEQL